MNHAKARHSARYCATSAAAVQRKTDGTKSVPCMVRCTCLMHARAQRLARTQCSQWVNSPGSSALTTERVQMGEAQ